MSDGPRAAARVGALVAQDHRACVGGLVLVGRTVQERPRAGRRVERQGVFGLVHVAAGDVEHAVGLATGAFADECCVSGSGNAVGAGHVGEEVVRGHLANMVYEHERHGVGVGQSLDGADGGVVGFVGRGADRGDASDLGEHVDDDHARVAVAVEPSGDRLVPALPDLRQAVVVRPPPGGARPAASSRGPNRFDWPVDPAGVGAPE
nr:hypothetical protein [Actinomadura mexicana]